MSGAPPQVDLFDYKPNLALQFDKDMPASVRGNQQLTGMTAGQARFPVAPAHWPFSQHGKTGTWISDLLPHTARMVDDLTFIKSTNTDAINHEPAIMLMNTGNMSAGKRVPRRLAGVRPWQHERQLANFRCSSDEDESEGEQPAGLFAFVEQWFSFV